MRNFVIYLLAAVLSLAWITPACARKPHLSPEVRAAQKQAKVRQKAIKKHAKAKQGERKRLRTHR